MLIHALVIGIPLADSTRNFCIFFIYLFFGGGNRRRICPEEFAAFCTDGKHSASYQIPTATAT